jgi:hypothetical protein
MAIRTGNIDMFAVKPESCFIVIEPFSHPALCSMAVIAVCCTILLELPVMIISMAICTTDR